MSSASSSSMSTTCLIIGGGIAGAAQALFLHRIGIECMIFEGCSSATVAIGGGMQLAPNGMNVMAFLGLEQAISDVGAPVNKYVMKNHQGKVLASINLNCKENYGHEAIAISRVGLHQVLMKALQEAGVPIHYSKRLVGIDQTDSSVTATFEDGTKATGSFLLGADGIHSRTRRILFPKAPPPFYLGMLGYGGFVPKTFLATVANVLPEPGEMSFTFGPLGFFGQSVGPKDDQGRELVMWWSNFPYLKQGDTVNREALEAKTNEEIKAELRSLNGDWCAPIPQLFENDSVAPEAKMLRIQVHDVANLDQWFVGRCLLIGDAAHAMSPNSGQGASQALEDTMQLGKLLRLAKITTNPSSAALTEVFKQFQTIRKPRVDKINAAARKVADQKSAPLGPWGCWFRDQMTKMIFWFAGDSFFRKDMSYKIIWDEEEEAAKKKALTAEKK